MSKWENQSDECSENETQNVILCTTAYTRTHLFSIVFICECVCAEAHGTYNMYAVAVWNDEKRQ